MSDHGGDGRAVGRYRIRAEPALQRLVYEHGADRELFEKAKSQALALAFEAETTGTLLLDGDRELAFGLFPGGLLAVMRWRVLGQSVVVYEIGPRARPLTIGRGEPVDELETDSEGNVIFGPEHHGLPSDDSPTPPSNSPD